MKKTVKVVTASIIKNIEYYEKTLVLIKISHRVVKTLEKIEYSLGV